MQKFLILIFKGLRFIKLKILSPIDWLMSYFLFFINGVQFSSFKNHGWPIINIGIGGICVLGDGFRSNNRVMSNPIGRFHKCCLIVSNKGKLIIGRNVGMSSSTIVCHNLIEIGDNVILGGNVVIYDTDFHSLNAEYRMYRKQDIEHTKNAPVMIGTNTFIGAHTTILKGITIGSNVIVGACSVVTTNIPDNQVWGGNPAKMIRKI